MSYYKQYVKPLIAGLEPEFFETTDGKSLKKYIFKMANPLFALKNRKEQRKMLNCFFEDLHHIYRTSILVQYRYFMGGTDEKECVKVWPYEYVASDGGACVRTSDKKKAYVSVDKNRWHNAVPVPAKYRGIIGRQTHYDRIEVNRSDATNNASYMWFVPRKGVALDEVRSVMERFRTYQYIEQKFNTLLTLAQKMRFRNAAKCNNQPRTGAMTLEQELVAELNAAGRYARAYDEIKTLKKMDEGYIQMLENNLSQAQAELQYETDNTRQRMLAILAKGVGNLPVSDLKGLGDQINELGDKKQSVRKAEESIAAAKKKVDLRMEQQRQEIAKRMGLQH